MKWTKNNTIRTKIALPVVLFSSCLLLVIILFTAIKMRSNSLEHSQKLLLAESREYAKQIQLELGKAIIENRTLCEVIGSVKTVSEISLGREEVIKILKLVLQRYPTFLGTYTAWEPNLFDGKDSSFANTDAHDKTGRFVPYVYRNQNDIVIEPIIGYDDLKTATWYFEPKNTKREMVIDPFYYQNMYMISIINPIIKDGVFLGVTGTDMSMDFIQKLVDGFSLYDGNASIAILSDNQTVVAAYKKPELAGKPINIAFTNFPQELFSKNQEVQEIQNDTLRTFVPFQLGESGKTWVAYIQVPKSVIMKSSNNVILVLTIIGIISVLILVYGIFYFSGNLTKPILSIAPL
ncbi:MAG: hypothetical protein EAZ07_01170 [Cytophagales bacterium]|nr:MAG: hypothetical protein EAZ07_01170 [Cytophagales bacterium]